MRTKAEIPERRVSLQQEAQPAELCAEARADARADPAPALVDSVRRRASLLWKSYCRLPCMFMKVVCGPAVVASFAYDIRERALPKCVL